MPCYHPLEAYQTLEGEIHFFARGSAGKRRHKTPNYRRTINLPCGRCVGCRLDRSKQWAIRLMHEAQLHEQKCFLTLTYADEALVTAGPRLQSQRRPASLPGLPPSLDRELQAGTTTNENQEKTHARENARTHQEASLHYPHFQQFIKSLRTNVQRRSATKTIRFYMCGEYGERLARPHYHAAIYGEDFCDDRYVWQHSKGNPIYRSSRLERLWSHGYAHIAELTTASAAYMARYIMKKITGDQAPDHYRRIDPTTGQEYFLAPEFNVMSRRPGIGKDWVGNFQDDMTGDYVLFNGVKVKPPRYYDKILAEIDPRGMQLKKEARENRATNYADDNTPARRAVKEELALRRLEQLKRDLE